MSEDAAPEDNRRTRHMAGGCRKCGAVFVLLTMPLPIDVVAKRLCAAMCPDCASRKIDWVIKEKHTEAVARLRREAALD